MPPKAYGRKSPHKQTLSSTILRNISYFLINFLNFLLCRMTRRGPHPTHLRGTGLKATHAPPVDPLFSIPISQSDLTFFLKLASPTQKTSMCFHTVKQQMLAHLGLEDENGRVVDFGAIPGSYPLRSRSTVMSLQRCSIPLKLTRVGKVYETRGYLIPALQRALVPELYRVLSTAWVAQHQLHIDQQYEDLLINFRVKVALKGAWSHLSHSHNYELGLTKAAFLHCWYTSTSTQLSRD